MGVFDSLKSGVRNVWGNLKQGVRTVHDFLTSGKASGMQKTLNTGLNLLSNLGVINKGIATDIKKSVGKGLSIAHDVTKKANQLVDVGDQVGNMFGGETAQAQ